MDSEPLSTWNTGLSKKKSWEWAEDWRQKTQRSQAIWGDRRKYVGIESREIFPLVPHKPKGKASMK